jgi:GAF domain
MRNRAVRASLVVVGLIALAGGAYTIVQAERSIADESAARSRYESHSRTISTALTGLAAAQRAYVAQGQGPKHWMSQADAGLETVGNELDWLATVATTDAGRTAVQEAGAAFMRFRRLDGRAREYVSGGQPLVASDLIFSEGASDLATVGERVDAARGQELAAFDSRVAALRTRQLYAAAGAGGLLLLALLLLAPVPQQETDVLTAMRALTGTPTANGGTASPKPPVEPERHFRDEFSEIVSHSRPIRRLEEGPPLPTPDLVADDTPLVFQPAGPAEPLEIVDLAGAARVCSELARVLDGGDLPALLTRAASVLDAPGLIVWLADSDGLALHPLLTHGYAPSIVHRLGSIPTDAENATAAAWRASATRVVPGDNGQPGALVVPIITANGCIGALAAEVTRGRERQPDVQALATIFAAQLATCVTTLPAGEQAQAGG